jgi:hypothetical protein
VHQYQLELSKTSQDIFISDKKNVNNFKLEGYHKEINLGIEKTEARRDKDVYRCSLTRK